MIFLLKTGSFRHCLYISDNQLGFIANKQEGLISKRVFITNIGSTCCHSNSNEKSSAIDSEKLSEEYNNNNNNNNNNLARELKKLCNMKVTIVPIVIGALGTVIKGLLKGLEDLEVGGRVETIQSTALLRTARILRRVPETWGDLLSLKLLWKTIS